MELACGVKLGHVEDSIVLTVGLLSSDLRVDVWVTNWGVVVLVVIVSIADVIAVLAKSWASVAKVVVGIWTITKAGMSRGVKRSIFLCVSSHRHSVRLS